MSMPHGGVNCFGWVNVAPGGRERGSHEARLDLHPERKMQRVPPSHRQAKQVLGATVGPGAIISQGRSGLTADVFAQTVVPTRRVSAAHRKIRSM